MKLNLLPCTKSEFSYCSFQVTSKSAWRFSSRIRRSSQRSSHGSIWCISAAQNLKKKKEKKAKSLIEKRKILTTSLVSLKATQDSKPTKSHSNRWKSLFSPTAVTSSLWILYKQSSSVTNGSNQTTARWLAHLKTLKSFAIALPLPYLNRKNQKLFTSVSIATQWLATDHLRNTSIWYWSLLRHSATSATDRRLWSTSAGSTFQLKRASRFVRLKALLKPLQFCTSAIQTTSRR